MLERLSSVKHLQYMYVPQNVTSFFGMVKIPSGVDAIRRGCQYRGVGVNVTLPWHLVDQYVLEWEKRSESLRAEADELDAAIAAARSQTRGPYPPKIAVPLAPQPPLALPPQTVAPVMAGKPAKAPKGENQRRIEEWLRSAGPKGAPIAQICKGSGVGQSSVDIVLKRGEGKIFRKDSTTKMWSLINL